MKKWQIIATLSLILTGCLSSIAKAGIGTDIGVYFPVGGGSKTVVETVGYSSFTVGEIAQELQVEERGGHLLITLTVTNDGEAPYTIEHRDGQEYDFIVLDKRGQVLWRWSDGHAFTQALSTSVVNAHQSVTYQAEIERKEYKKFRDKAVLITALLKDTPYTISAAAPSEEIAKHGSGAVRGAIRIGISNGHYDPYD